MTGQNLSESKDRCRVKRRRRMWHCSCAGTASHLSHRFHISFFSLFSFCHHPLLVTPRSQNLSLFTCHNTFINVSLLPPKITFHNNYCVNTQARAARLEVQPQFPISSWQYMYSKGKWWKVWESLLLTKLEMWNLDTEGWKRAAGLRAADLNIF